MKIKYSINNNINHNEIHVCFHQKNIDIVHLLMQLMNETLDELDVYDEYHNHYGISIISVYYIEVVDHKTFVYTKENVFRINKSLSSLKRELKKYGFFQINVRTLINKNHIQKYCISEDCRRKIYLDNKEVLIVNRHYKDEFEKIKHIKKEKI